MTKKFLKVFLTLISGIVLAGGLFVSCEQSLYEGKTAGLSAGGSAQVDEPQSVQNWTAISGYAPNGGGGHSVFGYDSNGDGIFLAAHYTGGTIGYSSNNGVTWSSVTVTPFSGSFVKYLAYLNDTFWAVGQNGNIATSPDGLVWTAQTQTIATGIIYAIAWNQSTSSPIYIAVSDDSKIIKKVGAGLWTDITPVTPSIKVSIQGVAYGSYIDKDEEEVEVWVIVCDNGYVSYSTDDGATWADLFLVYETVNSQYNTNNWKMVTFGTVGGTGYFLATTRYGVGRSTDGVNWDWDEVFPSSTGFSIWLNCVLYDGSRFLVSGGNGALAYYDGTWHADWQATGGGVGYWTNKIFNGTFVNGIAYNPDLPPNQGRYIATGGDNSPLGAYTDGF